MDLDETAARWGISVTQRTALTALRSENEARLATLLQFCPGSARPAREPRIARRRTRPSPRVTTLGPDTSRGRDLQSVRAFTRVFDEPIRDRSATAQAAGTAALKDMIAVRDHAHRCGTAAFSSAPSGVDAEVVQRLLRAGWSITGMTNMHALAYGTTGLVSEIGPAVNALDSRVVPGGSSSGSAVAVAAGDVVAAIGTDTGGSIRIPAALNGIVGLKPTYGRVPVTGVVPLATTLDHVGPMGRTVADTAAAFSALDGSDGRSLRLLDDVTGLRIGVPRPHVLADLDPTTRASFDSLVHQLRSAAVEVVEVDLDHTDVVPAAQLALITSEALQTHLGLARERRTELPAELQLRLESGMFITPDVVARAHAVRRQWTAEVDRQLEDVDALVTPTVAVAEPWVDQPTCHTAAGEVPLGVMLQRLTSPFNLSGHPAITVPYWEGHRRVPLGVQLITAHGYDHPLLALAEHLEQVLPARPAHEP